VTTRKEKEILWNNTREAPGFILKMVAEAQEEVICPLPGIAVDREKEPLLALNLREYPKS
jgi:hypothetical protein